MDPVAIVCGGILLYFVLHLLCRAIKRDQERAVQVRARVMHAYIDESGIHVTEWALCRSVEEAQALVQELKEQFTFGADFYYEAKEEK